MQFLKILLWVVIAVLLTIIGMRNWNDVTVNLWGDIQADIKLPVLLAAAFLVGFLPPYVLLRARRWRDRRCTEAIERQRAAEAPVTTANTVEEPQI